VPELGDGAIDVDTIKNGLKKLDEKWNWLIGVRAALRKQKKWPNRWTVFKPIEKSIDELLKLKEKRFLKGDKSSALQKQSKRLHEELHKQFTSLLEQLYFVKGFDYPADHL